MQGPPISEARELLMPSGDSQAQVESALRICSAVVAVGSAYSELLHSMILGCPQGGYHEKDLIRHSKVLDDDEAHSILMVVWRESPFITDETLRKMNLARKFPNGSLTAWGLATKIAASASELAKINTRIRAVGFAAEAYGLIDREHLRATHKPLIGTELLHKFMLALAENQSRLLIELGPLPSLNLGFDLPEQ